MYLIIFVVASFLTLDSCFCCCLQKAVTVVELVTAHSWAFRLNLALTNASLRALGCVIDSENKGPHGNNRVLACSF